MMHIKGFLYQTAFTFSTILISTSLLSSIAFAKNGDLEELLNLSLEELTMVSVASKREESVYDAPSVVNVISTEEIRRFGAQTLADLVNRMTNTHMVSSAVLPMFSTSIRGTSINHIDNHILVLMNGRPIRDNFGGGTNIDIYSRFPVDMIERIEVIRGPGSVLYGTNAFGGVINLITKKANGKNAVKVSTTYGSFDTKKVDISTQYKKDDFGLYASASKLNSDGWDYGLTDTTGTYAQFDAGSSGSQIVLNASYGGLSLNSIFGKYQLRAMPAVIVHPSGEHDVWRNFIDIGYTHNLSDKWEASFNTTYNGHNIYVAHIDQETIESRGILFEATTKGHLTDKIDVIFGGTYDHHDGSLGPAASDYNTYRAGIYAQGDYRATDWLKLTAGLQVNQPKGINKDISPRFAAVLNLNKEWGAKLLYGQSFRTAFGAISFNNNAVFTGNPNLEPEKLETYEAQLLYHPANYDFALTYYNSTMTDTHERQVVGGVTTVRNSSNDITLQGIEFEGKARLSDEWNLTGSLSYQYSEDEDGQNDVTFSPNLMAKFGISYDKDNYSLGVFNSYFSEAGKSENSRTGVAVVNPPADAYNLMTANFEVDLSDKVKISMSQKTTFTLFFDNILDENIHYPDTNRFTVNSVPQRSGRAIYGRLSVTF